MSADFIFEKKCTVWIQIRIELTTFLIIRYLIIFDKLSLCNYPLTHSQFFNLNMQILWVLVLKEWTQRDGSFERSKQMLKCWNNIMLDFRLSRPIPREDPNQAAHLQY